MSSFGQRERLGTGAGGMIGRCRDSGLRKLNCWTTDEFALTIWRLPAADAKASGKTSGKVSGKIVRLMQAQAGKGMGDTTQETTQEKILALLRAQPFITRRELTTGIGVSADGIRYHLDKLKSAGLIRHVGPTKAGHWEVLK